MARTDPTALSALSIATGAKRSRRKLALLNTAIEMFAEHGYDRVTIRELGDRMGMTSASLYRHYDGKAALLADAIDLVIHPMINQLKLIRASSVPPARRLLEAVRFHAEFALDHQTYLRVYYMEARHLTAEAAVAHRKFANQYRDHWVALILEGGAAQTSQEARSVYAMAMAMLNLGSGDGARRSRPHWQELLVNRTMMMLVGSVPSDDE